MQRNQHGWQLDKNARQIEDCDILQYRQYKKVTKQKNLSKIII